MLKQLALAALALVASATACPLAAKLVETTVEVPVEVRDAQGQIVRQPIKVTIFRDDARPRAPFMILNHGRSAKADQRAGVKPAQYAANARYFVSRGYAVFMPVRIGYGASGGPDVENSGPCAAKSYRRVYEAGTTQSLSVIEYAKAQPYVDPARGIVVGQSFGGTIAIALAARNVPGVLAGVNFAGGGGGRPDTHPEQPCSVERMTQLFASYGATARIPTLWVYSRNDKFWGPEFPRVWHKAFTDRGGTGEFVSLPEYKSDGHPSFTGAPEAWKPAFEAFLKSCCTEGKRAAAPEAASLCARRTHPRRSRARLPLGPPGTRWRRPSSSFAAAGAWCIRPVSAGPIHRRRCCLQACRRPSREPASRPLSGTGGSGSTGRCRRRWQSTSRRTDGRRTGASSASRSPSSSRIGRGLRVRPTARTPQRDRCSTPTSRSIRRARRPNPSTSPCCWARRCCAIRARRSPTPTPATCCSAR